MLDVYCCTIYCDILQYNKMENIKTGTYTYDFILARILVMGPEYVPYAIPITNRISVLLFLLVIFRQIN
jgi:hypothetical protein